MKDIYIVYIRSVYIKGYSNNVKNLLAQSTFMQDNLKFPSPLRRFHLTVCIPYMLGISTQIY